MLLLQGLGSGHMSPGPPVHNAVGVWRRRHAIHLLPCCRPGNVARALLLHQQPLLLLLLLRLQAALQVELLVQVWHLLLPRLLKVVLHRLERLLQVSHLQQQTFCVCVCV